jgi:hypothetical protein
MLVSVSSDHLNHQRLTTKRNCLNLTQRCGLSITEGTLGGIKSIRMACPIEIGQYFCQLHGVSDSLVGFFRHPRTEMTWRRSSRITGVVRPPFPFFRLFLGTVAPQQCCLRFTGHHHSTLRRHRRPFLRTIQVFRLHCIRRAILQRLM